MIRRCFLALAVAVLTLLSAEGLLSLLGRGTFGQAWRAQRPLEEEQLAAAALALGPYREHPDPRVGYVLQTGEFQILDGRGRADALGLRVRPVRDGASAWDDPGVLRVLVLGDSVAFGYGLADEHVLAARLEALLDHVRGPGERPIACRTVAQPGWTYRNQFAYLRDHWSELAAELVVYLPIQNDISAPRGVGEGGQMVTGLDPCEEDPWLVASLDFGSSIRNYVLRNTKPGAALPTREELGVEALTADVSRESSRRFDAMARAVLELEGFLEAADCRLVLFQYERPSAIPILFARLHGLGLRAPIASFLEQIEKAQTLGIDPHPNARTIEDCCVVLARFLFERGLLERGADRPLPPLSDGLEERLVPASTPELCAALAAAARAEALRDLRPVIDWTRGHGVLQVIGNVSPRGLIGARLVAVLRRGRDLRITLEALAERPDLYPMELRLEVDGVSRGPLRLDAGERLEHVLELPEPAGAAEAPRALEVRLVPERWAVVQHEKRGVLASCQLIALESRD